MFDLTGCSVERNEDQDYLVRWRGPGPGERVAVHMSDSPDTYYGSNTREAPLLYSTGSHALVRNPDPDVRHYFYLETARGEGVILAERRLPLQGVPNFRDLGGYEGEQGRRLKWGRLYRSSKLSGLTDPDRRYVRRLGLTLICDFRQVIEQELEPTLLGEEGAPLLHSLPVMPGSQSSFLENLHNGIIAVEDAAGFMERVNRDYVVSQMPRYAEMFQLLLAEDQQVLIHCASGKDRTGFGAALILDVLGVSDEVIVEDYLMTNRFLPLEEEIARLSSAFTDRGGKPVSEEVLRPLLEVRPEYIWACFEEIRRRYESREHFYEAALNLDEARIALLRERYLE